MDNIYTTAKNPCNFIKGYLPKDVGMVVTNKGLKISANQFAAK